MFVRIIQQPACANVVLCDEDGKPVRRLYQHTRERCEGYLAGLLDGHDGFTSANALGVLPPTDCGPGDFLKSNN